MLLGSVIMGYWTNSMIYFVMDESLSRQGELASLCRDSDESITNKSLDESNNPIIIYLKYFSLLSNTSRTRYARAQNKRCFRVI